MIEACTQGALIAAWARLACLGEVRKVRRGPGGGGQLLRHRAQVPPQRLLGLARVRKGQRDACAARARAGVRAGVRFFVRVGMGSRACVRARRACVFVSAWGRLCASRAWGVFPGATHRKACTLRT